MPMQKSDEAMLPCPWCGAHEVVIHLDLLDSHLSRAFCMGCKTGGPWKKTRARAINAWNTRHLGQTLTNEIGGSPEEGAAEACQAVIDNEASLIKRASGNPG